MMTPFPSLLAAIIALAQPQPAPLYGAATVIDGDTLRIGSESIRLFGIDAPEHGQMCTKATGQWPCGMEAAAQLSRLVAGKRVRCLAMDKDVYGRTVARCDVAGIELNRAMVDSGYATAFRDYSADYIAAETRARARRAGLWAGTFEQPADYRARRRRQGAAPPRAHPGRQRIARSSNRSTPACVIKGNRSRRGEWIYHLPGMPYYEQTRPEEIFCSEADARAAGYRRARVR